MNVETLSQPSEQPNEVINLHESLERLGAGDFYFFVDDYIVGRQPLVSTEPVWHCASGKEAWEKLSKIITTEQFQRAYPGLSSDDIVFTFVGA